MQYLKALFGASVLALLVDATPIAAQSFLNIAESVVEEHPRVQSAESLAQAGRSDASAARAALRPQLGLSADVGWDGRGSTARAGRYFLPEITASQLMFDGGRTAANTRRRSLRAQSLDRQQDRVVDDLLATLVDRHGEARAFSGAMALGIHAQCTAPDVAAAGNLLADRHVPEAMAEHFRARPDAALGARLIGALRAGLTAGGEAGPVRSAGLLIVGEAAWPVADLRVDWADDPLGDLEALWRLWEPQMEDYVRRGLDPTAAPSFGVAGDP